MIGIDTLCIHSGWKICTDIKVSETSTGKKKVVFGASAPRPDNTIWVKKYFTAFGYLAEDIEKAFKEGRLVKGMVIPAIYANEHPYKASKELNVVHDDGKVSKEIIQWTQFNYDIVNMSLPIAEKQSSQQISSEKSSAEAPSSQAQPAENSDPNVLVGMDAIMDFMGGN